MPADFSTHQLPALINGRRYSHEMENPAPIPENIRVAALELLRVYYTEVSLNERTFSEASGTSAPARSEVSTGTSNTEMTFVFSANNGSVQHEHARRRLPDVQRARKALLRKLQACPEDCRIRKVKCQLWHHALRDLLKIEHSVHDEWVVEWAIRYDADSQTPIATTPVSARVTAFAQGGDTEAPGVVIDQTNNLFGLDPGTPMPYGLGVHETDASLLENSEGVSPSSFMRENTIVPDAPVPSIYNTYKDELMFPLGSRENMFEPPHYSCWFPECVQILPMQELISHFTRHHLRFERLDDPLRMVCPVCDKFYMYSNDQCLACYTQSGGLVEKLYGRYFPDATTIGLQRESGAVHAGFSSLLSSGSPDPNSSSYQGSSSNSRYNSHGCGNYPYGSSGSPGGNYYSRAISVVDQYRRSLFSSPILSRRLFRTLLRHRKYVAVLILAVTVSLILGYKEHNWIVSTIAQLTHGVSTVSPSKLPLIGVMLASVAFGLHRIVVSATRAGGIRSGWLSRCALSIFNVACGRRRVEWSGPTGYELGHSRS